MTTQDLFNVTFARLNDFKRHRALSKIAELEGNREKATYHALKTYELFDSLELAIRALQKDSRNSHTNS
jgi:hypothetical protein